MKVLQSCVVALAMYSKIPMPHLEWNKENMRYTVCFFPVVGAVIGALCWLWYGLSVRMELGSLLQAAGFVLIPVLVTGGIHLDGLLDTADALSSWQTRERRLEILKDSHAGAFAIIVCCSYFTGDLAIWTELRPSMLPILCLGFVLSRALSGFGIAAFPCAKNTGLVATFANSLDRKRVRLVMVLEIAGIIGAMLVVDLKAGLLAAVSALVVCLLCKRMAEKKFGGITGDIQGFFLQACELAMAFAVILGGR